MTPNYQNTPAYQQPKSKLPMWAIAIIITLIVLVTIQIVLFIQNKNKLEATEEARAYVEEQKVQLESELNELIIGYDSLKTESDSINVQLAGEQEKIRRLLKVKASNTYKIKMYEKELKTLRTVMRSYIIQIDSLNTRNRELTEENIAVRTQMRELESDYDELTDTKEQLSETVALAQKLTAKNIVAVGLNNRSKEKDKIAKIEKLRVCFTIRENQVAESGDKMIYVRIVRPDEVALSSPDAGMFEVGEESIVYTAKRELEFDNMDIDMCVFWDKTEELIPGTYNVFLYSEAHEIGATSFDLK